MLIASHALIDVDVVVIYISRRVFAEDPRDVVSEDAFDVPVRARLPMEIIPIEIFRKKVIDCRIRADFGLAILCPCLLQVALDGAGINFVLDICRQRHADPSSLAAIGIIVNNPFFMAEIDGHLWFDELINQCVAFQIQHL